MTLKGHGARPRGEWRGRRRQGAHARVKGAHARVFGMPPALAAVLALAACTSGGSVSTSSSSSAVSTSSSSSTSTTSSSPPPTSASSSPTYVPVKPAFPAAAKPQTLDSAAAFVKYFYDLVNYAFAKPEAGLLGPLGTDGCTACARYEEKATDLVRSGQHFDGKIVDFVSVDFSTENLANPWVTYKGEQPGTRVVDAHGATVETSQRKVVFIRVVLKWTASGWRIESITNT